MRAGRNIRGMHVTGSKTLYPPAHACALCGKTLEEVGGKRMVVTQFLGVSLWPEPPLGGSSGLPVDFYPVDEEETLYLIVWGEPWSTERVDRAIETAREGKHPWFCQVCGGRACEICGSPLSWPQASEIIHGSGRKKRCMSMPAHVGCVNPNCPQYWRTGKHRRRRTR